MGAYDFGLYRLTWPRMGKLPKVPDYDDLRINYAVKSIQVELIFRGFEPDTHNGMYTFRTYLAVKRFQYSRGLRPDGQIGLVTSRKLFTKRMNELSAEYGLPPKVLCGLVSQESGFDPAAVGFLNPSDRGLVQINAFAHRDVTDAFAFTAQSALQWGAERLANSYEYFSSKTTDTSLAWKCAIANHNKIYVMGGVTPATWVPQAANEVYDAALNTWEKKEPLPTPRGFLSSAVVNGIIYAIGGGYPTATSVMEAYDPATNTWAQKQNMLSPRAGAQTGVVNGIIYNVGGNASERNCEAYDPVTDRWTQKTPRPESGGDLAVTVYNGLVYTFGGGIFGTAHRNVYAYDPQN